VSVSQPASGLAGDHKFRETAETIGQRRVGVSNLTVVTEPITHAGSVPESVGTPNGGFGAGQVVNDGRGKPGGVSSTLVVKLAVPGVARILVDNNSSGRPVAVVVRAALVVGAR
jgi:hypothetical protein